MTEIAQTSFRRENELLLLCARTQMRHGHLQNVTHLTQEKLNWVYLLATAAQHGILPLLFQNLSACYDVIPQLYLHQLRTFYKTNSMRNQFLAEELITILRDFKSERISTLPFKGPALAAMAYGDLSLREFVDLDILVHQSQLTQAFHVMKEKGYLLKGIDREEDQTPSPRKKTYTFTRGGGLAEIRVDLQSLIIGENFAVPIDDNAVWDRVTEVSLARDSVPSLAVEDLLITLCIHGSKHLWEKTKWICDVAELIQRYQHIINWNLVTEQADRLGGRNMLELGLEMAQNLKNFGITKDDMTPECFKEFTASNRLIPVAALWLGDQLFNQLKNNQKDLKAKAFYLFLRNDLSNHFRKYLYLCLIPLPQKYWPLLPHPRLFAIFYRFVVLLRSCGKYGLPSQYLKLSIARWLKLVGQ
jgi:hypothetical protein